MIHVAICDDEQNFVAHLTKLLQRYMEETGMQIRITCFYDGLELLEHYDPSFDLIFLDIQMKLVNGLRTAEKIRQMDQKVGILFLTTLVQYGLEGYKYGAVNYVLKPIQYVRLKGEMDRFLSRYDQNEEESLVVVNDTGRYKIYLRELVYIETCKRNLLFHTEGDEILCYKTMREMEKELAGKGFLRSHASYLVNMAFIKSVKKLDIQMLNGEILPISQPKRKVFMEKLTEYWGDCL